MGDGVDGGAPAVHTGNGQPDPYAEAKAAAEAAKTRGNEALKSADLPMAIDHYEDAITHCDEALQHAPQAKELRNNDLVMYGQGRFATIDTAYPQFGDYILMDLTTRDLVKHKVGRHDFDLVSKRFLRKEIHFVPRELFDLRLACLQNITLASLKIARGSTRASDYQEAARAADAALAMDGRSAKALMRKGQALVSLKDYDAACRVLTLASQETRGKDPEVQRLLMEVLEAKGKGKGFKGKGLGKGKGGKPAAPPKGPCSSCEDPSCEDSSCARIPEGQEEDADSADEGGAKPKAAKAIVEEDTDEELRNIKESDWKPVKAGEDGDDLDVDSPREGGGEGDHAAPVSDGGAAASAAPRPAASTDSAPAVASTGPRGGTNAAAVPAPPQQARPAQAPPRVAASTISGRTRQAILWAGGSLGTLCLLVALVLWLRPYLLAGTAAAGNGDLEL